MNTNKGQSIADGFNLGRLTRLLSSILQFSVASHNVRLPGTVLT